MLFWSGVILATISLPLLLLPGYLARVRGRHLSPVFARAVALMYLSLLAALMFSAFGAMFSEGPNAALKLAAVFAVPVIGGPLAILVEKLAPRFGPRATASTSAPLRALDTVSQLDAVTDGLPDAPLGKSPRAIDVASEAGTLVITIPIRQSRGSVMRGVLFMAPGVFMLGRLLYLLVAAASAGAGASLLLFAGTIGVVGNLIINIPFWLVAAWGAHLVFGDEVAVIEHGRALVRKTVWGHGMTTGVLDTRQPLTVRAERGSTGYWCVVMEPSTAVPGRNRPVRFGMGNLTGAQAEVLAAAVEEYLASPGRPVLSV